MFCTTLMKLRRLIFHVFDWQENSWSVSCRGHGGLVGTIVIGFAKYPGYCGLIFLYKRYTTKSMKIYAPQKFLHIWYF